MATVALNIASRSSDWRARELSNFSASPFTLDDSKPIVSVEGFLQGIKFPADDAKRYRAFELSGIEAKRIGTEAKRLGFVWWGEQKIPFASREHRALIGLVVVGILLALKIS